MTIFKDIDIGLCKRLQHLLCSYSAITQLTYIVSKLLRQLVILFWQITSIDPTTMGKNISSTTRIIRKVVGLSD